MSDSKREKKPKKKEEEEEPKSKKASSSKTKGEDEGDKKKSKKVKDNDGADDKEEESASSKKKKSPKSEESDNKKKGDDEDKGDSKKKKKGEAEEDNKKSTKKKAKDSESEEESEEEESETKKEKDKEEKDKKDKKEKKGDEKTPRKKGDEEDEGDKKDKKEKKGDEKASTKKTPREKEDREKEKEKEDDEPKRTILRAGQLYLVVSEAKELAAKNKFKKGSDPFVEIFLDDGKSKAKDQVVHKSKVLKKELDPNWNESSKIFPIKEKHKSVKIVLKSAGLIDSFLGQVIIPLPEINDGVPVDKWFSLEGKKKKAKAKGKVHVQLLFLDGEESMLGDEFAYPLHCFIKKRKVEIVSTLINQKKANIEQSDMDGHKPLHVAALNNLPDVVSILLDAGAKINAKGGPKKGTPLHAACSASTASAVILLEKGAKVDVTDEDGNKPLHIAALNDQPKSIACLLERGAAIGDQNKEKNTALHLAIQAKAFLSLKLLVDKGADIYIKNKAGFTCGEAAADLDEETKEIFMKAVGVEDYQEIALLQTWKHRIRLEATGLNYEWQKSPQFAITAKSKAKCRFFVHHIECPDNQNLGYCVVRGKSLKYKEPSLSELLGHGSTDAFEAEIDPDFPTVVVPYAKSQDQPEKLSLLVFTQEEGEVDVVELAEWQYNQSVKGQWKGKMAGGCQSEQNRKTWHKNPFFSLHIPEKADVDLCIVLQQKKNAMESIIPYQILPYDFYIGFYLYDADVEELIGQTTKWKNAMEVLQHFTLDGTKLRQFTIIPTTFNAKEETTFTLTVFANEKRVTLKAFEA